MELGNQANNHLEARLGAPLADKRADPLEARLIDGLEDELGDWLDDSSPGGLGAGPEPPEPPLNPASGEPDLLDPASPDTQARLEQIQRLWRKACQEQRHSLRTEARPGTRAYLEGYANTDLAAEVLDISDGGACLLVGRPFRADSGQRGVLRFGKAGGTTHRQVVEICWQEPWEQGLALGVAFSRCRIPNP